MNLGNFLIGNGVVKVSDFGLGKRIDNTDLLSSAIGVSQTGAIGAMMFRAPEAFTTKYTSLCDIWSFGVIGWVLWRVGRPHSEQEELDQDETTWFERDCDLDLLNHSKLFLGLNRFQELAKIRASSI